MSSYWKKHWNSILHDADKQSQVGRTVNKKPISSDIFKKTFDWVSQKMEIKRESVILELCCGNGVWTTHFSRLVKHVTAVDFSEPLLNVLKTELETQKITNVEVKSEDVSVINDKDYKYFTHIFWYFAIQHFSEREIVFLFETAYNILKNTEGGTFYIGDIPDKEKLWEFVHTKEYTKMYFDSVKNNSPAIGTWFMKKDLMKLAEYTGFAKHEIIDQPKWQINSNYRFDMKLEV